MCLLRKIGPMHLNLAIEEECKRATHCSICGLVFKDKFEKVRNHDHITGDFLGIAHRNCNLQYKQVDFLPVVLLNLRGFDAHLIMQQLGNFKRK